MKLLVFGGGGQLGYELLTRARDLRFEVLAPVISELDIADQGAVVKITKAIKPAAIINAAAYTAVDKAEVEQDAAFSVNSTGAHNVAVAAKAVGCRLIHVSTDYVFSGTGSTPLSESDATDAKGVYGCSKLEGEKRIRSEYPERSLIVRTSSLHGQRGENFVHTMLKLFADRDVLKVVDDQRMSPTWAGWLAEALLDLTRVDIPASESGTAPGAGVVHASGVGNVSWFEFASAIHEDAKRDAPWKARLERTTMAELARPAPRPKFSVFNVSKLTRLLGRSPIDWREGLRAHLSDIGRY